MQNFHLSIYILHTVYLACILFLLITDLLFAVQEVSACKMVEGGLLDMQKKELLRLTKWIKSYRKKCEPRLTTHMAHIYINVLNQFLIIFKKYKNKK